MSQIWDRSLLNDFARVLLDNKKDVYKVVSGVNLGLRGRFEDYMAAENLELLGVLHSFPGVLGRGNFRPPNSYIVRDLVSSVQYLKESIPSTSLPAERNPSHCTAMLQSYWSQTLKGTYLMLNELSNRLTENFQSSPSIDRGERAVAVFHLARFMDSLLGDGQYVTILDQTPTRWAKVRKEEILIKRLQLHSVEDHYFKEAFLSIAGISHTDLKMKDDMLGPIDELKASNLVAGPFGVALTDKPSEHLTFSGSHSRSTVRLLDIKGLFRLYIPQRTGVARYYQFADRS